MKKVFKVSLLAAAVVLTVACNEKTEAVTNNTEAVVENTEAVVENADTFKTTQEKAAYAIGSSLSIQFNSMLEQQAEIGMPLDKDLVLKGIADRLNGSALLTEDEIKEVLSSYGQEVQAAAEKKMKEDAAKIAEEGKAYLEANAKKEGVTVTESGLQYSVVTKADGPKPTAADTVTVHYVGTLIDGTTFDSSVERGQPATFPLNQVIPGWTEGVQLMSVGEKYKFVIPAELAYGDQGAGTIPAGSTLLFDVELLDIKAPKAEVATDAPEAEAVTEVPAEQVEKVAK
jgi:FKBP-type peptidyl-prolyl cis-trans isomerase FkpA